MIIEREHRAVFTGQLSDRRRRGRPRVEPRVATSVKLPEPVYDALCRHAIREGESLHHTMQKALTDYAGSGNFGSQTNPSRSREW